MNYNDDQADIMHMIDSFDEEKYFATHDVPKVQDDPAILLKEFLQKLEWVYGERLGITDPCAVKLNVAKHLMAANRNMRPHVLYPEFFDGNDHPIKAAFEKEAGEEYPF